MRLERGEREVEIKRPREVDDGGDTAAQLNEDELKHMKRSVSGNSDDALKRSHLFVQRRTEPEALYGGVCLDVHKRRTAQKLLVEPQVAEPVKMA